MSDLSTSNNIIDKGANLNQLLQAVGLDSAQHQYNGLPWRGPSQWIDNHRPDTAPVQDKRVHLDIIDTTKPDDITKYEAITSLVVAGKGVFLGEEVQELKGAKKGWLIMVRWIEMYYRSPDAYESYWQRLEY